ncbi:hypothetical protein ANN_22926 [Periplaneta americana]|uniref:Uncharacterized protein n=1 Tax=Periplaneta americana TaxID=6978 RepID=A0ABQ8SJT1_PERAM|nr:hypothetical protein ANN_22926 [Periplaneta americana]
MLAGSEFQSLGRAIVKEVEYEEMRWDAVYLRLDLCPAEVSTQPVVAIPAATRRKTLGHVLGFCRKTELLRNNRHHKARTGIADVLKRRGWEVHEEIHCVSSLDLNRRADIVAIHRTQSKGIVLDPTIRFERDALQAQYVDEEKKSIYESCIPYLKEKRREEKRREEKRREEKRREEKRREEKIKKS